MGSCRSPLLPTVSCCPQISSGPCDASLGISGSWGWSHFPESFPTIVRERSSLSEALPLSSFALFLCLSQLWGPARQWWRCQGGSVPVGQLPLPPQPKDSKCLLFGGERWPRGGEGCWWECAKPPAAPCQLWNVSQRPRARRGSRTPTRCPCGTWRSSSSSALPVGGCGNPAGTPLSKTLSMLQRAPHPGKGLNPQGLPSKWWQRWNRGDAAGKWSPLELAEVLLVMLEQLQGAGAEAGAVLGIATGASHPPVDCPSPASSWPPLANLLG